MKLNALSSALLATLALGATSANALTVGGVTWNPDAGLDFTSQTNLFETPTVIVGQELSGIGWITAINGAAGFCSGCELTYQFGGYHLVDLSPSSVYDPDGAGPITAADYGLTDPVFDPVTFTINYGKFQFTGGWLKVYVDTTPDFQFDASDSIERATNGDLWLDLQAVDTTGNNAGATLNGSLTQLFSQGIAGQGTGLFDVVGGLVAEYLDTNTQTGGRDLSFSSSFQPNSNTGYVAPDGWTHFGTAEIHGESIPEPSVLALMGLGLLGLGLSRRQSKKA